MSARVIFITGDRSADLGAAVPLIQQVLLQQFAKGGDLVIFTGPLGGIEESVRFVCEAAGISINKIEQQDTWLEYAQEVKIVCSPNEVLFIHGSPESSRIYPALAEVFSDAVLTLVTPELVFVPTNA